MALPLEWPLSIFLQKKSTENNPLPLMNLTTGDKHLLITFEGPALTLDAIAKLTEAAEKIDQDVIIDLSKITSADADLVEKFGDAFSAVLDDYIVILVGDEDELDSMGFLFEEFPVTPTYNEAMDFLFMLQLEKDLGLEE